MYNVYTSNTSLHLRFAKRSGLTVVPWCASWPNFSRPNDAFEEAKLCQVTYTLWPKGEGPNQANVHIHHYTSVYEGILLKWNDAQYNSMFASEDILYIMTCWHLNGKVKNLTEVPKVAVTFNDIVLIYIFLYKKQFGHRPHELQVHFVPPQKLGTLGVIKSCCFSRFCTWLPSLCGLCRVHGQHFWRECLPGGRWKGEMSTRIAPRICNNMYQPARVHPDLSDLLESR